MTNPGFLQFLLLANVFIMGAVVASAIRHAYAHFHPEHHEADRVHSAPQVVHIPPAVKQRLLQSAQDNFQTILNRSANDLQHELTSTATHINAQLDKLGTKIINDEMDRYSSGLEQLRQQAEKAIGSAQADIDSHQTDLKAKLAEQQIVLEAQLAEKMAIEQQTLIQNIDTKLADAVASFLTETLQHNVDLGAQSTYLISMLEEHKAEFIKGTSNEA